jgi:uncharacterized membrane-anchored protein YhcB (DUF1043 family)
MKRTFTSVILLIMTFGLVIMPSCKNRSAERTKKKVELEKVKEIQGQIETNVYPLPTSAQVIKMLTELQVGYIIGISNSVENTKKYFTSQSRALNLGVYGADLSYATLYNVEQEVINYLNSIRTLASELNMGQLYNEELYDKIKKNFDNRDELVNILTKAFNDSYSYLSDNGQQSLALLVVGGAWVEGMYLTTHVSEAAYNIAGISGVLLEQKKSFEMYLDITKPYAGDPVISDFLKLLDPIKEVYKGLGTSLNEQNIKDITRAIEDVRSKVVL